MMPEDFKTRIGRRPALAIGGAIMLVAGAAGGAGAMALTRPSVEMAPTTATPIARLGDARGIVTVKGQVESVFGDRVLVRDPTGHTLVDVGRRGAGSLQTGAALTAQGRFADGQLHARYLVMADGTAEEVGPPPPPPHGPGGPPPGGPRADAPPPPPPGAVPPPPPGNAPPPPPPGSAPPPPPVAAAAPAASAQPAAAAAR